MTTCPKGHQSASTDYCDECGTLITAAPSSPPAPGPAAGSSAPGQSPARQSTPDRSTSEPTSDQSTSEQGAAVGAAESGPCPDCGTPRTDRFCEVCGHDFLAEPRPDDAGVSDHAEASAASSGTSDSGTTPSGTAGPGSTSSGTAAADTAAAGGAGGRAAGWQIVVTADRSYHERMRVTAGPDAAAVAFPAYCPQRRFVLTGTEVLIGRTSRSRGIQPGIDLVGPPEDPAVSHMHALLVANPDGGWSIVDLDSANGTYLNEGTEQLAANQPVALADGDRVHIGGWTTLTIHTA